jgi:hypothetical protein
MRAEWSKGKSMGQGVQKGKSVFPEISKEARATGSNEQGNNDTKKNMLDNRSGDFTPWSVSKSTDIVGWYCGMGQLID